MIHASLEQLDVAVLARGEEFKRAVLAAGILSGDSVAIEEEALAALKASYPIQTTVTEFQHLFDRVVILNLARRADRRTALEAHLKQIQWPFVPPTWFRAVDGARVPMPARWKQAGRGAWGCMESHRTVLRDALNDDVNSLLVLEDDVEFVPDFVERARNFFAGVPADWQQVMLGGQYFSSSTLIPVSDGVLRVINCQRTHAYAVRGTGLRDLYEHWRDRVGHCDHLLPPFQKTHNVYAPTPWLAAQAASYSDIFGKKLQTRAWNIQNARDLAPATVTDTGVVILSVGSERRRMLWEAIASARRKLPRYSIHVASDVPTDEDSGEWLSPLRGKETRAYKTTLIQRAPFVSGLILDDDAVVSESFDIEQVLGDADLAMAPDAYWPTIGEAAAYGPKSWCTSEEAQATLRECGAAALHFNSGVIFFRRTPATTQFAKVWHEEWKRWRDVDQLALARAVARTPNLKIGVLPPEMHARPEHPSAPANAKILHFAARKKNGMEEWRKAAGYPAAPVPKTYTAFSSAVNHGLCVRRQYAAFARSLKKLGPCRLLVFGTGHDSTLWRLINRGGETVFTEHAPEWAEFARTLGNKVELVEYPSKVREWCEPPPVPDNLLGNWDAILVDAPQGAADGTPGRQIPIFWAAQLKPRLLAVHDYERAWERKCCDIYLGAPGVRVNSQRRWRGDLALWGEPKLLNGLSAETPEEVEQWLSEALPQKPQRQCRTCGGNQLPSQSWGPRMWKQLHDRAFIPNWNVAKERARLVKWVAGIPCAECMEHFRWILKELPPALSTAEAFLEWSVAAHNLVNKKLGKPELSLIEFHKKRSQELVWESGKKARIETCRACPHFLPATAKQGPQCVQSTGQLKYAIGNPKSSCPMGRWGD